MQYWRTSLMLSWETETDLSWGCVYPQNPVGRPTRYVPGTSVSEYCTGSDVGTNTSPSE